MSSTKDKKKNPYTLVCYRAGWSNKKTEVNNLKYWKWEMDNNGFDPSQYYS